MSEHGHTAPPAPPGGIDTVAAALKAPVKRARGRKKSDAEPRADATASGILPAIPEPAAPVAKPKLPTRLPEDAPVKALGTFQGDYSFLDSLGQVRTLPAKSISRNEIIALFGGDEYLKGKWPIYEQDSDTGLWRPRDKFNHDVMSPVLISSCTEKGVWNRDECVRGPGTWREDGGALVMHCGQRLYIMDGETLSITNAGLHGELLYSRRPALPEPLTGANTGAGEALFEKLISWNWVRGETDARLALGWLVSAMIGQAAPWRPMMWVTGGKGTGKSTLFKLFVWILGKRAAVKPTDPTPAYVYQKLGDSSLPVLLDEFESKDDNRRADAVINLMRIAASGGEIGRGGTENNPRDYNLKSSFAAFSIIVPPLAPQDLSRLAILKLNPLADDAPADPADEETDWDDDDSGEVLPTEQDTALGYRETWDTIGRQLRGRILTGWARYMRTYNAYFKALKSVGHDPRGASQFGALGAAYDLAMYNDFNRENVNAWIKMVPPSALDETRGYDDEPQACLQHLLGATIDLIRGGARETVSYHLREAYRVKTSVEQLNDPESSERALAKIGIKLVAAKDKRWIDTATGRESAWWVVEISNTHQALMAIFDGTHWKGKAGSKGGWAQALSGLSYAEKRAKQSRIDGAPHWVTQLALAGIFPTLYTNGGKDE